MRSAIQGREIILASASPRRKELMALAGLTFRTAVSSYQEDMGLNMPPRRLSRFLALEKAKEVASRHAGALIIAADTFIYFRGHVLGKPKSAADAARMLRRLSGRSHTVITGFSIIDTVSGKKLSRSVETRVWFRRLTQREIAAYVASGEPMDKAGAYAIQGLGSVIVSKIEGDYFNVIGLPLSALIAALKEFGIRVL